MEAFAWSPELWHRFAKTFVALLAIVDPLACLPLLAGLGLAGAQRERAARVASATALFALLGFAAFGPSLLSVFGVSMGAFKVGGGLLLFTIALSMMNGAPPRGVRGPEEAREIGERIAREAGVVPLGIPLLAGPAAMTHVVIQGQSAGSDPGSWMALAAAIAAVALASWLTLSRGALLADRLGPVWIGALGRVLGLLLAAVSVEVVVSGLSDLFPGLAR